MVVSDFTHKINGEMDVALLHSNMATNSSERQLVKLQVVLLPVPSHTYVCMIANKSLVAVNWVLGRARIIQRSHLHYC